jgi:hypothetical protein
VVLFYFKKDPQRALWISYCFDIPRRFSTLQAFKVNILQCIPNISIRVRVHLKKFQVWLEPSLIPDCRLLVEPLSYFYPPFEKVEPNVKILTPNFLFKKYITFEIFLLHFSQKWEIRYLAADYPIFSVFTMPSVITLWYYLCHHK